MNWIGCLLQHYFMNALQAFTLNLASVIIIMDVLLTSNRKSYIQNFRFTMKNH